MDRQSGHFKYVRALGDIRHLNKGFYAVLKGDLLHNKLQAILLSFVLVKI